MVDAAARGEGNFIAGRRRATAKINLLIKREVDGVEKANVLEDSPLNGKASAFDPFHRDPGARGFRSFQLIEELAHRGLRPAIEFGAIVFKLNRAQNAYVAFQFTGSYQSLKPFRVDFGVRVQQNNVICAICQSFPNANIITFGKSQVALVYYHFYLRILSPHSLKAAITGSVIHHNDAKVFVTRAKQRVDTG